MFTQNLLQLRRQRELTQQGLARKAGISLVAYRNIETGVSEPRAQTLHALANALGVSVRDLLVATPPLQAVRFRAQKKMKCRAQVLSDVKRWLNEFTDIENLLGAHEPYVFHDLAVDLKKMATGKERALFAARRARDVQELSEKEAIRDICGLIESAGIKVYPLPLESEGFFGLSVASHDGGPAIVVNVWDRISVERWIFSTAHELGHLLMHLDSFDVVQEDENENEELEANQFASHFLMSEKAFRSEWDETYGLPFVERVLKVKRIFRVSYRTVLFRLIEEHGYPKTLWRDFQKEYHLRFGKRLLGHGEPRGLAAGSFQAALLQAKRAQEPSQLDEWDFVEDRLRRLVRKGVDSGAISLSRGAEILGVKLTEMRQIAVAWRV